VISRSEGGSTTGLSAISARLRLPMICSRWGLGPQIASFFQNRAVTFGGRLANRIENSRSGATSR
jgi:hypothetical protein